MSHRCDIVYLMNLKSLNYRKRGPETLAKKIQKPIKNFIKMPKTFQPKVNYKLTHAQCRAKVCIICFERKKSMRDLRSNADYVANFKKIVGPNFDIENPRIPSGLCDYCRKLYFSKEGIAENKTFTIPQYLQFVVAPANVDEVCDCEICLKARQSGKLPGRKPLHSGGRPIKKISSSPIMKKN